MPVSFKSFFIEEYLEEQPGPWRPDEHLGTDKPAHDFHRAQFDHHVQQKRERKHQAFKQLQKGVIYKSNSGTWVGQKME